MTEKPAYTLDEVAEMMGFCRKTVLQFFEHEPGVIVVNRPTEKHKRRYRSFRIPHYVFLRVVERMSNR